MEYQELASIWNSTDLGLEQSVKINKDLVKRISLTKIKSRLFEIKGTAIFELIVESLFSIFLIGFIIDHVSEIIFSLPAGILLIITLFSLVIEIYKLKLYYSIDASSSVIEAQKKLTKLKKLEIQDIQSLYIIIPLFSAPFLIVTAKAFLNLSLYSFGTNWLIYHTLGSFVVALIIVFFLKRYPDKNLMDSIAFLDELKDYEG
jgi:hypothetical protein